MKSIIYSAIALLISMIVIGIGSCASNERVCKQSNDCNNNYDSRPDLALENASPQEAADNRYSQANDMELVMGYLGCACRPLRPSNNIRDGPIS